MWDHQSELSALRAWDERRGVPLVWYSSCGQTYPAPSFGRMRANTQHTQSASKRESVGGSDRGSSVGHVSVAAAAGLRTRGEDRGVVVRYTNCGYADLFNIGHHSYLFIARTRSSLITLLPTSSQTTCIYPACSFLTRTYTASYAIRTFNHPLFSQFIQHWLCYHSHAFRLELICPYIRYVPSCPFINPSLIPPWPIHLWGLRIIPHFPMYILPGMLAITCLESPVATKVPAELYQPNSRTTFNQHAPVLPLVLHVCAPQTVNLTSTSFIFCLGPSMVSLSQSLLVLVHISRAFAVPHLCTTQLQTLLVSADGCSSRSPWLSTYCGIIYCKDWIALS